MDIDRTMAAAESRKGTQSLGAGVVLALAIAALASATALLHDSPDVEPRVAPSSVEPALHAPAPTTMPISAQAPRAVEPSEADRLLQTYAPHGG